MVAEYFIFPFCDFIEWSKEEGGRREGGLYGLAIVAIRPFLMTRSGDRKVIIYDGALNVT